MNLSNLCRAWCHYHLARVQRCDPSRRAFLLGGAASSLVAASNAEAALGFLHRSGVLPPPVASGNTLTPVSFYKSAFAGRGADSALPALDLTPRADGTYPASTPYNPIVTSRLDCWDRRIIEAGQTLVITNVAGNGDLAAVQVLQTIFSIGASGSFAQVAQSTVGMSPLSGAVGHQVTIQAPTQINDSWCDLVADTIPANGIPNREIIRIHFKGTSQSGALRKRVYVSNATATGNGNYKGDDAATNPLNPQTPFATWNKAKLYAAQNQVDLINLDETTGLNPTTITSSIRSFTFPTVYLEDYSGYPNAVNHCTPIETKTQYGGRVGLSRSFRNYLDSSAGLSPNYWISPSNRTVDYNIDFIMSDSTNTNLFGTFSQLGPSSGTTASFNNIQIHYNCRKIDLSGDDSYHSDIRGSFKDVLFPNGIDCPQGQYIGDFIGKNSTRVSCGHNFLFNSSYEYVGCDIISSTNFQGSTILSGFKADQSRFYYDLTHLSKFLLVDSVFRDPYNELTTVFPQRETSDYQCTVSISGTEGGTAAGSQIAYVTSYVPDGTYSKLKPNMLYGIEPSICGILFPQGPLSVNAPATGFATRPLNITRYTSTVFQIDVSGLGYKNVAATSSGVFTFTSLEGYIANGGAYDSSITILANAAMPSNIAQSLTTDQRQSFVTNPSWTTIGAMTATGAMQFIASSTGLWAGSTPPLNAAGALAPLQLHTPRIVISGTTLTGRGFLNGGLNSTGGIASSPAAATQDAPAPTTYLITSTDSNGRTLARCVDVNGNPAAPPPSALLYRGCTIFVNGQKAKVAPYQNFSANASSQTVDPSSGATAGVAAGQPGYSFYITPKSANWADITSPTAWSFADNMHGVFKSARLVIAGTVYNVLDVQSENIIVDVAPGDTTTPTTFGIYTSGTTTSAFVTEAYYDNYGVALPVTVSSGVGKGDKIQRLLRQHPDLLQEQNDGLYSMGRPVINGFIQDMCFLKGFDVQPSIVSYPKPIGPGTFTIDANGQGTIVSPGTLTISAIDNVAPQPYACFNNGNVPLDFIGTPDGLAAFNKLLTYKITLTGANTVFSSWSNGNGNIRFYFTSGALAGLSMKLFSMTVASGTMTAYVQDDLGIAGGNLTAAVGDTVQQPIPLTTGVSIGVGNLAKNGTGQCAIVTCDPNNPLKVALHGAGLDRFAGQTGLTYYVLAGLHRLLFRSYHGMNYSAVAAHGGLASAPIGQTATVLSDMAVIQSSLLSGTANGFDWQCQWSHMPRMRVIDSNLGGSFLVNGGQLFDDAIISNTLTAFAVSPFKNANVLNCVTGYVPEFDQATGKPNALYTYNNAGGAAASLSLLPRITTPRFPYRMDGSAVNAGEIVGPTVASG